MKKIALLLAFILVFATPLTVQAVTPRSITINPEITFDGTTANCSLRVYADSTSEDIGATIKLWHGNFCLRTWTASGEGYIFWEDTATVAKGYTYKLTVDVTIDGVSEPRVYIIADCE